MESKNQGNNLQRVHVHVKYVVNGVKCMIFIVARQLDEPCKHTLEMFFLSLYTAGEKHLMLKQVANY